MHQMICLKVNWYKIKMSSSRSDKDWLMILKNVDKNLTNPLIRSGNEVQNVVEEDRVKIMQAINIYIAINMTYEAIKLFWSFWHYQAECPNFAYLSIGFMILNCFWALTSFWGFKSITTKNCRNIRLFWLSICANIFLRSLMYIICGAIMKGYVPSYNNLTENEIHNRICAILYPEALYVIQGLIQAIVCVIILYNTRLIYKYVQAQEEEQIRLLSQRKVDQY